MRKITVLLFLVCCVFGAWQKSAEISLPKSIQVNDLTINKAGEIWILSASSLLRFEPASKNPLLVQEIANGKALASSDKIYILDNLNHLSVLDPNNDEFNQMTQVSFNLPRQIAVVAADENEVVAILESNQLTFTSENKTFGSVMTVADRFSVIPAADYSDTEIPFFTLADNRVYSWIGGSFNNTSDYRSKLIYSASNSILDIAADLNGDLFILFPDSIVVLGSGGDYKSKIEIDNLAAGSKILTNPANSNLLIFDKLDRSLIVLTGVYRSDQGEVITLDKNTPNPVDNYTAIQFTINQSLNLVITVYNLIGEPVKVVARGFYPAGSHTVTWHADDEKGNLVPNGVYFYRLESEKGVAIRQLIVLR